jgi:hypothetical protein
MCRSGCIWCTHVAYLNDAQEYRYLADAYRALLDRLMRDASLSKTQRRFAEVTGHWVDRKYSGLHERTPPAHLRFGPRYFIASFSKLPDDLSQWRAYGGGGIKFAIGFRVRALEELYATFGFKFGKMAYGFEDIEPEIRKKFLDHAAKLEREWLATARCEDPMAIHPPEYLNFNFSLIDEYAPLRKHPKFLAEVECRLYGSYAPSIPSARQVPIELREGKSFLIPYMAVPVCEGEAPVASLTIGPTSHREEARAAVEHLSRWPLFAKLNGRIQMSEVPYRD